MPAPAGDPRPSALGERLTVASCAASTASRAPCASRPYRSLRMRRFGSARKIFSEGTDQALTAGRRIRNETGWLMRFREVTTARRGRHE